MAEQQNGAPSLIPVEFDPFAEPLAPSVLPLTEPQQEMWLAVQMGDEASCAYNQCFCLTFRGPLSVESMENALRRVVDRHEALRTRIDADGEHQEILAAAHIDLPLIDLSHFDHGLRAAEIQRILDMESHQPFDLAAGYLVRALLIREAPDSHRLILTVHHIVCDGWSSAILFDDLARLFVADRNGLDSPMPDAASYREYVAREVSLASDPQVRADQDYWAGQYSDSVPILQLPLDRPRPAAKTFRGACQQMHVDESVYGALKKVGAKHGCTLFVTLLAAFQVLVSRLSGQNDFVAGIPMAGQALLDNQRLVGHCVNMIPLRCQVDPAAGIFDHLKTVRRTFLEAQSHQRLTFGSLVRCLNIPRDPSRTPLVSVTFNIDKLGAAFDFGQVAMESVEVHKRFVNFEISINVVDTGRNLLVECEYNTDLFTAETVERWLNHFHVLLNAVASDHDQRIDELPLLSTTERDKLLVEWNKTAAAYPRDSCMHELFEAQVQRTPDAVAVEYDGRQLTYRELDAHANQVACYLARYGVGPEVMVGVCLERGWEMVVGMLGILKAGGAYVPLDPDYPAARLAFMLEDTAAPVLLTQVKLRESFSAYGGRIICLDTDWAEIRREEQGAEESRVRAHNLAYIIYTSGSTGKPKGVAIEHRNAVNFLSWAQASFTTDELARTLFSTSLNFDLAMYECFVPLSVGATVKIAHNAIDLARKPLDVTLINTVPSAINALLDANGVPSTVRTVNLAGEPLKRSVVERLFAQTNVDRVCNLYGPSETTTYSTWVSMRRDAGFVAHIGRPIANTLIYLLDTRGQPVPIGVAGEIYIGGDGVARGYLNRPELTNERFIADPFANNPHARMYRTGDLARYLSDGNIEFLGRIDHQVKVRGFRIELGEIETALCRHPAVREAVVLVHEPAPGDQRLVAYFVAEEAPADLAEQVRALLRASLPEYMVPGAFVVLDRFPLTANGKIDRKALPAPLRASSQQATYVAPRTTTEKTAADIWAKALHLEQVGVRDNFFELGGHSLMLVRMISEINISFKTRLGMADVIQNPTVEQLAGLIDRQQPLPSRLSKVVLLQEGRAQLPVYLIYAGPGELRLAQQMAGSHSVFGIEARWPMAWRNAVSDNRTSDFPTMEQMVAPYVAELSTHAGSAPCVLAGFCYAGRIAFEAAHQLQKLGGEVKYVILIDTDAKPLNRYKLAWQMWSHDWKQPSNGSLKNKGVTSLASRIRSSLNTTGWLLGKARKRFQSYFTHAEPDLTLLSGVFDEHGAPVPWALLDRLYMEIDKTYRFRGLNSRGVLFRTEEFDGKKLGYAPDDALGWEALFTQGVEIIPIAGHHFSIWGSQIPTIAKEINRVLEQGPIAHIHPSHTSQRERFPSSQSSRTSRPSSLRRH